MALAANDIVGGKFRIVRLLGEGGMGTVYEAVNVALEKRVALKILKADLEQKPGVAERFAREGRAVARIDDPHVCAVLDVGTFDDGRTYLVMEYLAGESLAHVLEKNGALPEAQTVDIALDVCHAVASAHAAGVVHRDLKPDNVMIVARPDGGTMAKVLDFGIAKLDDVAAVTGERDVLGTPQYLSPEQFNASHDVDGRTDIWALGVMLYEMVGGELPFRGSSIAELVAHILIDEPRDIHALRPELSPHVCEAISGCLVKERAKRIATVTRLAELLGSADPRVEQIRRIESVDRRSGRVTPAALAAVASSESLGGTSRAAISSVSTGATKRGRRGLVGLAMGALLVGFAGIAIVLARPHGDTVFRNPEGAIEALSFSEDHGFVFTVGGEGSDARLRRWDAANAMSLRSSRLEGTRGHFSSNGASYGAIREDGKVDVWNVLAGVRTAEYPVQGALVVTPLASGGEALVGHADGSIRVWKRDAPASTLLASVPSTPSALRLSHDETRGLVGTTAGEIVVVDMKARTAVCSAKASDAAVVAVALTADGTRAAVGDSGGHVTLWSTSSCAREHDIPTLAGAIGRVRFVRGTSLLAAASGTEVVLVDVSTFAVKRSLRGHGAAVVALADSPDGKRLASGDVDGVVHLWPLD